METDPRVIALAGSRNGFLIHIIILATVFLCLNSQYSYAQNYYGAIAYSKSTGAYGYSGDYPTRAIAEERALSECRARGSGCEVVIWFRNACAALATAGNGARGWAWSPTKAKAERSALEYCKKHGGRDCVVLCWSCSTRP